MNIVISGYGRMGKEVEKMALEYGHQIVAIIDQAEDFNKQLSQIKKADVAIDFSIPEAAADNILHFFEMDIPVVVGTTGWLNRFHKIETFCKKAGKSLFWASNMSIGVNLFFKLNQQLAAMMSCYADFTPSIEETHHIHKKDAPSGTAITLAKEVLNHYPHLKKWELSSSKTSDNSLVITSIREGEIVGEHKVCYHSEIDEIEIRHTAFSRKGFALGSLIAAKWLQGKKGVFGMEDLLNSDFVCDFPA